MYDIIKVNEDLTIDILCKDIDKNSILGKESLFNFDNEKCSLSEYAKYIILSQCVKTFSRLICELDKTQDYHRKSVAQIPDPNFIAIENKKYLELNKKLFQMISEWKENNKEKFDIVSYVPSIQIYAKNFNFTDSITLDETIQGYKYSKVLLDAIDMDKIRVGTKKVINPNFKDEYKNFCEQTRINLGIPSDSEIKEKAPLVNENRTRICLNRQKYENEGGTYKFINQYVLYFINEKFNLSEDFEE